MPLANPHNEPPVARAVLGRATTISAVRSEVLDGPDSRPVVVTTHPSAVLRAPDDDRTEMRADRVADLRLAWSVTRSRCAGPWPPGEQAQGAKVGFGCDYPRRLKDEGKVDRAGGSIKDKVDKVADKVKGVINPDR
jgi:hypothetical protein